MRRTSLAAARRPQSVAGTRRHGRGTEETPGVRAVRRFVDEIDANTKTVLDAYQHRLLRSLRPPAGSLRVGHRGDQESHRMGTAGRDNPGMAASLLSPLMRASRLPTRTRKPWPNGDIAGQVQPDRDGIRPGGGGWAEVVGSAQAARTVDWRREEGTGSKGAGRRSSSTGPSRRRRNWTRHIDRIRDSLQKCIDEGAVIILE